MVGAANDLNITESGYQSFNNTNGVFHGRTFQAGTGITILNPDGISGNTTISLTGGGVAVEHLTGNTGGRLNPDGSNNFNLLGTGSITIAGSGSTLTTQLTGLTANSLLYGLGTATIGLVAVVNNGVLTTGTGGTPVITALASNGQLIIGSGSGAPAAATLSAGTGITITNAANSITISASSSGFTWTDVTTSTQTIAAENGYITDRGGGVTYTLPVSGSLGDTFKIVGKSGITTVTPLALQQLLIGSASGTVGITGTAVSTNAGDCITFVCITSGASTVYRAESFVGNWILS